jgi:predicted HAD superfamily phosphohydrolase YqeG
VRVGYEKLAELDQVLGRVQELSARTVIFDVEPLVAHWEAGQEALDRGVALVVSKAAAVPGLQVVCFATNSLRRPSIVPDDAGVRVVYLASAGKPLRTSPYAGFPKPGVVIGDQLATDGILARRLGYEFLQCCPPSSRVPAGPRLMNRLGSLVRPLLFTRPG